MGKSRARRLAGADALSPGAPVLGALALWTLVPLLTLIGGRGVFDGGYGLDVPDQMQYMAFIRDSERHVLISNLFDVVPHAHLLLDPGFALSGLVLRLGVSVQFALLMWVPISMIALLVAFAAYARRLLAPDRRAVVVVLLLAFFFVTPAMPLADWLHGSAITRFGTEVVGLELFAGAYAWGTVPAIAIALVPVCLLATERLLDGTRRAPGRSPRWYAVWAGLAGMLCSWLHPWQGMTVLVIFAGLVAWGRLDRRYLALALPAGLTAAPLVYFYLLSRTHSAFGVASQPAGYAHVGWWFALGFAPALLALPGYFGGGDRGAAHPDLQERLLRLWPAAALVVYFGLTRTWFYHALDGLTLPLALLAWRGWSRLRLPRGWSRVRLRRGLAVAVALFVTVPGLAWSVVQLVNDRGQDFLRPGESRLLAYLDSDRRPGAVLAPVAPLGQAVPGFTGRQTYVGHYEWTPDMAARTAFARALFDGRLPRGQALALVRASGVRFLAADCSSATVDLSPLLGDLVLARRRFGCATLYELR